MKVLIWYLNKNFKIREFFMKFFDFFCNHFIFVVLLTLTKKGLFYMRCRQFVVEKGYSSCFCFNISLMFRVKKEGWL